MGQMKLFTRFPTPDPTTHIPPHSGWPCGCPSQWVSSSMSLLSCPPALGWRRFTPMDPACSSPLASIFLCCLSPNCSEQGRAGKASIYLGSFTVPVPVGPSWPAAPSLLLLSISWQLPPPTPDLAASSGKEESWVWPGSLGALGSSRHLTVLSSNFTDTNYSSWNCHGCVIPVYKNPCM